MEPLPDWFDKMFRERAEAAKRRIVTAQTTEQVWEAKGRMAAFVDLEDEMDIVKAQAAEQEREAAERFLKTDA